MQSSSNAAGNALQIIPGLTCVCGRVCVGGEGDSYSDRAHAHAPVHQLTASAVPPVLASLFFCLPLCLCCCFLSLFVCRGPTGQQLAELAELSHHPEHTHVIFVSEAQQ